MEISSVPVPVVSSFSIIFSTTYVVLDRVRLGILTCFLCGFFWSSWKGRTLSSQRISVFAYERFWKSWVLLMQWVLWRRWFWTNFSRSAAANEIFDGIRREESLTGRLAPVENWCWPRVLPRCIAVSENCSGRGLPSIAVSIALEVDVELKS